MMKKNKETMTTVADGWAVDKKYTSAEGECHRTENQKRDKLKVAAGHPANMKETSAAAAAAPACCA